MANAAIMNVGGRDYNVSDSLARQGISGLQTSVSGLQTSVSGLQTSVSGLQTSVSGLQTDMSNVKQDITDRVNRIDDYFDQNKLQQDRLVDEEGNVASVSGWACTGLIPVHYGDIIRYAYSSVDQADQAPAIVMYKSDFTFFGYYRGRSSGTAGEYTVHNSAIAYIRYNVPPTSVLSYSSEYLYIVTDPGYSSCAQLYKKTKAFDYFSADLVKEGYYLSSNDGQPVANSSYCYLDVYVPVQKGDLIIYPVDFSVGDLPGLLFYDAGKKHIGNFVTPTKNNGRNDLDNFYFVDNDNIKFIRYNVMINDWFAYSKQYLKLIRLGGHYTTPINFFSEDILINGKVVNSQGEIISLSGYAMTELIPVEFGDYIQYAFGWPDDPNYIPSVTLYDVDKQFLEGVSGSISSTGSDSIFVGNRLAKYIRYNVVSQTFCPHENQYFAISTIDGMIDYAKLPCSKIAIQKPVYYVGSTRSGENTFKKLIDVCEYIENNNIKGATVYFDAEEFDIATEYGSTFLDNYSYVGSEIPGPRFGFDCHYIFHEGSKITFTYSGSNDDVYYYFSPINICGSCIIDGATVIAENCRYCVHDDLPTSGSSFVGEAYTVEYRNCYMEHEGNTNPGGGGAPIPIGGGCNKNTRHIFDGGVYISHLTTDVYEISYHNYSTNDYGAGTSTVILKNVYMVHGFRLKEYRDSIISAVVCGCYMPDGIDIDGSQTYFDVKAWNNTIANQI